MRASLVTRPAYGNLTATAGLPEGPPSGHGRTLDDSISGYKTFVKPVDDHSTDDSPPDGSIYRQEGPRDIPVHQENRNDSVDLSKANPSFLGLGDKDPGDYSKTHYPHRDDKPNTKNADSQFVAQLHILESRIPLLLTYEDRLAFRVAARSELPSRVAATAEQILAGLNPKFVARSQTVQASLKRADIKNLRWIFSVTSSSDKTYAVKIKASRPRKNTTKFSKMDLEVTCSCPAWQWQGPEYHAKVKENYLLGNARGTASTPDIRDPERQNRVCKHVASVLSMIRQWEIPVPPQKLK